MAFRQMTQVQRLSFWPFEQRAYTTGALPLLEFRSLLHLSSRRVAAYYMHCPGGRWPRNTYAYFKAGITCERVLLIPGCRDFWRRKHLADACCWALRRELSRQALPLPTLARR